MPVPAPDCWANGWVSLGYQRAEALDLSARMLAVAARKRVYGALHNVALGGRLPFEDGYFAGIVSAGVFTTGHVGASALNDLLRITRPGGVIVLTVKGSLWADGFADRIAALDRDGQLHLAEQTAPYVSMPGEAGTSPSLGIVLKRPG